MKRIATVLALVVGLAVVCACSADQTAQRNRAAEQTAGSKTQEEAVRPFAPEVAEEPAARYAPDMAPSNYVKGVDNPYFPLEPGTTWAYEGWTPEGIGRVEDTVGA